MSAAWYRFDGRDLVLQLKVQPKASRDRFAGVQADRMRVQITAPPVDGKANRHLLNWLAGIFGVAKSAVALENGTGARFKRVRVSAPRTLPPEIPPQT